jgi:hypothetical protein
MDDHFYNNDFEKFLQQQVKHHRMYPSDAVWKGIYKQMHGYKKWPGLYFFAILMVASLTVCTLFIESEPIVYPEQSVAKASTLKYDHLDPAVITEQTIRNMTGNKDEVITQPVSLLRGETTEPVEEGSSSSHEIPANYDDLAANKAINTELINITVVLQPKETVSQTSTEPARTFAVKQNKKVVPALNLYDQEKAVKISDPTDAYLEEHPEEVDRIMQQQVRTKISKWQLQFYIAPSMNYRVIVDEKTSTQQSNGPVASNYGVNASKVIRYNPGMGIEFGFGAVYNMNKRLNVKAALQYNIRQYNIEAFAGSTELAKIALFRGGNIDTLTAISRFRSTGVYGEAQLLNKYHQVSLPVGLEYSLFASKRLGLNLGGTIQPTYTFSESSYLLSSDYKSYADGKSILRRWNLNSSLEATFTYKAKNVQWKIGPQLRYQHLPNYTDAYPIKEYLIDYGFKIGFTKAIR